jgi:lipopolysaccharide transport system permease protein
VIYRDVGYVLPFLTQIWFFVTPIVYSSREVLDQWGLQGFWRVLYYVNPMVGVVDGFRWAILGVGTPPGPLLAVSVGVSIVVLVTGLYYFRHMERTFADEI